MSKLNKLSEFLETQIEILKSMETKISESIWSNGKYVIPMAEVSHIEYDQRNNYKKCAYIIFKHSKFANESDVTFSPNAWLDENETRDFLKDWCYYRSEVEELRKEAGI